MKKIRVITAAVTFHIATSIAFTQTAQSAPKPLLSEHLSERTRSEAAFITAQLKSRDASKVSAAIDRIQVLTDAGVEVPPEWIEALFATHHDQEVEAFATRGILNTPDNLWEIPQHQKFRVLALQRQGKAAEALVAAKQYYNVCDLQDTENAVQMLVVCLASAHSGDSSIAGRFKSQQVAWASPTTQPTKTQDLGENVLKSIPVDGQVFEAEATRLSDFDFATMIAKGNLLLLADKGDDAKKAFEAAEAVAESPDQTAAAVSGIAKAIRATAGAVGPANAFILAQQKAK